MTRRSRLAAALGLAALLSGPGVPIAAAMDAPRIGTMLVDMPLGRENEWRLVDMRSGAQRTLPRSEANPLRGEGFDVWSASASRAHVLMRASSTGVVEFFDGATLRPGGGFALSSLPGTRRPKFFGNPRLSPDGRYILAYWKADIRQDDCELVVLDRQGHIVERGSPLDYDTFNSREAIAWLPDGRYIHTAGNRIVVRQIGNPKYLIAPLHLPPHVSTGNATLAVSPDGKRLALTLNVPWRNNAGVEIGYSQLFVAALDGNGLRALTVPSQVTLEHAVSMAHGFPSWAPDGRWLAIAPKGPHAMGAISYGNNCLAVLALPADGAKLPVDGLRDPAAMLVEPGTEVLKSCDYVQWLDW
jgi:hypothetical protein